MAGGGFLNDEARPMGQRCAFLGDQVARRQSLPLFHPATAMYRKGAGEQEQPAHDGKGRGHDRTRCSEGSLVFCPKNGVHFRLDWSAQKEAGFQNGGEMGGGSLRTCWKKIRE